MSVGAKIQVERLRRNESLQQVADSVGASKVHIWQLEKNKTKNPSLTLVTRLADHFGVSVAFLVGEDVEADDVDPRLQRMFRQAKHLNDRERQILDDMIRSLLGSRSD